ncbi:response regulator [Novipirellula artificiosorum]|uniref:Response regulator receiver domain protein n=1 Tax=Novipirellula artificiosorum TaxID=2528016 RepID=A0A5C6E191_9BACT|nr:response regulator [Novipirellula artificiosorum]TWU42485.1 Response regulator receiver domain protein [Novipirellula artificiosorum]
MQRKVRHDAGSVAGLRASGTKHATPPTKQASIVVVDPSPLSLLATAGVFHYEGYACTCARTAEAAVSALALGTQDLLIWDVADDATAALEAIQRIRQQTDYEQIPVVLLADTRWAGLEKKTDQMAAASRCLFKPVDPHALIAVADQLLWMPSLISAHRKRGSQPTRPGWVTL